MHAGQVLGMDCLETDGGKLTSTRQTLFACELLQTEPNRRGVVPRRQHFFFALPGDLDEALSLRGTDTLDAAARQNFFACHVEQAILETGAAQIGHENLHDTSVVRRPQSEACRRMT